MPLTAKVVGLHARADQTIQGNQIVICDPQGQPVAIVVAISPTMTKFYSVAVDPAEFHKAAASLGIPATYQVEQLTL